MSNKKDNKAEKSSKENKSVDTVKMEFGDNRADVHPDEVEHMKEHGWSKVK